MSGNIEQWRSRTNSTNLLERTDRGVAGSLEGEEESIRLRFLSGVLYAGLGAVSNGCISAFG